MKNIEPDTNNQLYYILIIGLFVLSHGYLALFYNPGISDIGGYGNLALELREEAKTDSNVYNCHKGTIEYPPLSLVWMSAPAVFLHGNEKIESKTFEAFLAWKSIF